MNAVMKDRLIVAVLFSVFFGCAFWGGWKCGILGFVFGIACAVPVIGFLAEFIDRPFGLLKKRTLALLALAMIGVAGLAFMNFYC